MADFSKMKSPRRGLGAPPSFDEAATSLNAPEVAPVSFSTQIQATSHDTSRYVRKDGRSARKTHRTLAFATRVSPEFDAELREIADNKKLKLVELLEEMLIAYKQKFNV